MPDCLPEIGQPAIKDTFDVMKVREMGYIYEEMIVSGSLRLQSYDLSASQHRIFLEAIRCRLGMRLEEDAPCPVS